jgi:tRNA-specific 2-thiouridylase
MKTGAKIFVGLSGGVDSAVSAALLKRAGYDVTGLFAWITILGYPCTASEDRREALRVAAHLGIPFMETDLSAQYRERVFSRSLEAYRRGETPNPDALCNREIKFGLLYEFAMEQGAEYVATGHYARTQTVGGETHLLAGVDEQKDQSYFLWAVPQARLEKTLFPVGNLRKPQVRKLARKFGLPNAKRKDSQGLCFLGDISIEDALVQELRPAPGDVLDEAGSVVGRHRGAALYTIGQRHGFEIRARGAHEEPHYVIAKDIGRNSITVSAARAPASDASAQALLREANWIGEAADGPCQVRFRYHQPLMGAKLTRTENGASVALSQPQYLPAGQSMVLYRGERCLGGGVIEPAP